MMLKLEVGMAQISWWWEGFDGVGNLALDPKMLQRIRVSCNNAMYQKLYQRMKTRKKESPLSTSATIMAGGQSNQRTHETK